MTESSTTRPEGHKQTQENFSQNGRNITLTSHKGCRKLDDWKREKLFRRLACLPKNAPIADARWKKKCFNLGHGRSWMLILCASKCFVCVSHCALVQSETSSGSIIRSEVWSVWALKLIAISFSLADSQSGTKWNVCESNQLYDPETKPWETLAMTTKIIQALHCSRETSAWFPAVQSKGRN